MNSLSWFLYVIDVVGTVSGIFTFLTFASAIVALITLIMAVPLMETGDFEGATAVVWRKILIRSVVIFSIFFPLSAVTPSQKTMYLILGSEIGEDVVMSETAKRVRQAVNMKLDEYLDEAKKVTKE